MDESTREGYRWPPKITAQGDPVWFHPHGTRVRLLEEECERGKKVVFGSMATKLTITPGPEAGTWRVEWHIIHSLGANEDRGFRIFSNDTFGRAFGFGRLRSGGREDHALLQRFGGTNGQTGKYIRCENYLNIPGPGTGHDGDPNISLTLHEVSQGILDYLGR